MGHGTRVREFYFSPCAGPISFLGLHLRRLCVVWDNIEVFA